MSTCVEKSHTFNNLLEQNMSQLISIDTSFTVHVLMGVGDCF